MKPSPFRMASALIDFARNARWGTCAGCPVDDNGDAKPELCRFTQRYDHNLTIDDLAFQVKRDLAEPR